MNTVLSKSSNMNGLCKVLGENMQIILKHVWDVNHSDWTNSRAKKVNRQLSSLRSLPARGVIAASIIFIGCNAKVSRSRQLSRSHCVRGPRLRLPLCRAAY